jgi:membrane fusion protein, heavy metal efflux system
MNRRRGQGATLGIAAIVTGCLSARPTEEPRRTSLAAVATADVAAPAPSTEPLVAAGRVVLDDARVVHVFSPVDGQISWVAEVGTRVARGQTIAMIASPDVAHETSDVQKAVANYIAEERNLGRMRQLTERGEGRALTEDAEDGFRVAKAELERARQKAASLRAGGGRTISEPYVLTSPIAGTVLAGPLPFMQAVMPHGTDSSPPTLFVVADLDRVFVLFDLPDREVSRVTAGSPMTLRAPAFPGVTFHGSVDTVTLDAQAHVARLRGVVSNFDAGLRPEVDVTVTVPPRQRE